MTRTTIVATAWLVAALLLVLPLASLLDEALRGGPGALAATLRDPDVMSQLEGKIKEEQAAEN